jgi:5-methylcytosine-specific restriction endonuclease McrA
MNTINRNVLVLNKSWVAVNVITLRRAIKIVYKEDASIVVYNKHAAVSYETYSWEEWEKISPQDDEEVIRTSRNLIRVPKVIVLHGYNKIGQIKKVNFSRRGALKRDEHICQYCGEKGDTIDHVVPKSMGGKTSWENCVAACVKCNARKANRTPDQARMKLSRVPYKPRLNMFKGEIPIHAWGPLLDKT